MLVRAAWYKQPGSYIPTYVMNMIGSLKVFCLQNEPDLYKDVSGFESKFLSNQFERKSKSVKQSMMDAFLVKENE
jgi:hypothetical protein